LGEVSRVPSLDELPGSVLTAPRPGGTRIHLRGRLDAVGAGRLRAVLEDLPDRGSSVLVDLSRSGALPVAALRALAAAHARLQLGTGELVLERPSSAAALSLRTSGLDRVLRVEGGRPAGSSWQPRAERGYGSTSTSSRPLLTS
jgi:anti-anti-sigma regulatory factor